jgi:MYXO-CTERM domain-containing protein
MKSLSSLLISSVVVAISGTASAAVVTQWTFNTSNAALTLTPYIGTGTASYVGGTAANSTGIAGGWDVDTTAVAPVVNNRWTMTTFPAASAASGTAGAQFAVSTAGFENVIITFGLRTSNASSKYAQLQYSTNGTTFADFGNVIESAGGDAWNLISRDFSSLTTTDNNSTFAFRVVSVFAPGTSAYAAARSTSSYSGGTYGFDLVTVNGTAIPSPGAVALLGLAGLVARRRR